MVEQDEPYEVDGQAVEAQAGDRWGADEAPAEADGFQQAELVKIPTAIEELATELLPEHAHDVGYALHYQPLGQRDDQAGERYRVSYSLLQPVDDGFAANDFSHAIEVSFDRETGELTRHARLTLATAGGELAKDDTAVGRMSHWLPTQMNTTSLPQTLVARMFDGRSYSTSHHYYSLYTTIANTAIFNFGIPHLDSVGLHDKMSSFYLGDVFCAPTCRVGNYAFDVDNFILYKHVNYDSSRSRNFGGSNYDGNLHNNRWEQSLFPGRIEDNASSMKVRMSVFSAPVLCGDNVCEGGETAQSCHDDCGYCGDNVCSGPENAYSCHGDCGYCGDRKCTGGETVSSCPSDCQVCGDNQCTGYENAYTCHVDCGYCGDGFCTGSENSTNCSSDCSGGPCFDPPCLQEEVQLF